MSRDRESEDYANTPLRLPPHPASVARSRVWLGELLSGWSDSAIYRAQLLVSELVTNALLHARTPIDVLVRREDPTAWIDVVDYSPTQPLPKHFGADAATGRGLLLVSQMALTWGVRTAASAKTVWFQVADEDDTVAQVQPVDLSDWPDLEDAAPQPPAYPSGPDYPNRGVGAQSTGVRILGLPVSVYLEAEEYNDALMREFALIAATTSDAVPRRLIDLADEVTRQFGTATTSVRSEVERAIQQHRRTLDLTFTLTPSGADALLRLSQYLDEADRYCEMGGLLTLTSSPVVRHYRHWFAEQIVSQTQGWPPQPWSYEEGAGPDQGR